MPNKIEYKKDQELGEQCYYQYDVSIYNRYKGRVAVFKCRCGNLFEARIHAVKTKNVKSCGCLPTCCAPIHGGWGTRLYSIWNGMKDRCNNCNSLAYPGYGGKGIQIDPAWDSFIVFKDWALSNGYAENLTLDRIDPDGNYTPSNCRWADNFTQARNRSKNKNNKSGYKGVSFCKSTGRYKASIGFNNKQKTLGRFDTPELAAKAYNEFVITNNLEHRLNDV